MYKSLLSALTLSSMLAAAPAFAGADHVHGPGGHTHGVSVVEVTEMAVAQVKSLVERGKVEKSWLDVPPARTRKQSFDKGSEWVVTFTNDKVSDPAKRTLYVFYTLDGKYLATNFTGK